MDDDSYKKLALWKKRRNELELLFLTKMEDLKPGDAIKHLRKLEKAIQTDKNVFNCILAVKYFKHLIDGSKKLFIIYGSAFFPVFLEKFKEKNDRLSIALHEALVALFTISTPDVSLVENIKVALQNKSPRVKAETLFFVSHVFMMKHSDIYLQVIPSLLKLTLDRDCLVRKRSAQAIASAVEVHGNSAIQFIKCGDIKSKDHSKQYLTFKKFQAANQISNFYTVKF